MNEKPDKIDIAIIGAGRIRIDETGQKALANCLSKELYDAFAESCALLSLGVRT